MINKPITKNSSHDKGLFILTIVYLVIEYARPMDFIPVLALIRPGLIVSLLLLFSFVLKLNLSQAGSTQTKYLVLFLILLTAYIPFAVNTRFSFDAAKSVFLYVVFFFAAVLYINSFERLRSFFFAWILIMIYLAARGIINKGIAGTSFLQDENDFSLLMNMMLPFGIFLFMYEKSFKKKMLYLTASVLAIISIVFSSSRGGFIGLIAVLGVVWLFSPKKIVSLFVVTVLVVVLLNVAPASYWDRMETITAIGEGTAKERIDSWKAGWNMFLDNPLGVGGGNFSVRFPEYQPEDMPRGMYGRVAHSFWFTLISETGILGIVFFVFLTFANLRDINWIRKLKVSDDDDVRFSNYLSMAFIAGLFGFFVSGTFISVNYYPHFYYLTAMIVVTRRIVYKRISEAPKAF